VKDAHPSEAIALVDLLTFLLSYSPLAHANAAAQRRRDGRPSGGKALPHNASGSYVASFRGLLCEGRFTRNLGVRRLAAAFARLQCILRRGGTIVCAPRRQSPTGRSVCPSGRAAARAKIHAPGGHGDPPLQAAGPLFERTRQAGRAKVVASYRSPKEGATGQSPCPSRPMRSCFLARQA
jgi:hypothetical protein